MTKSATIKFINTEQSGCRGRLAQRLLVVGFQILGCFSNQGCYNGKAKLDPISVFFLSFFSEQKGKYKLHTDRGRVM